jgi:hypothetical protein
VADLRTDRDFFQAEIHDLGAAGVHLSAPIARLDALRGVSREVVIVLLLEASASVRMARSTLREHHGKVVPAFEVRFPFTPTMVELNHALCALSAACETWGPEIKALADRHVANVYKAVRGWSSRRSTPVRSKGKGGIANDDLSPNGFESAST